MLQQQWKGFTDAAQQDCSTEVSTNWMAVCRLSGDGIAQAHVEL